MKFVSFPRIEIEVDAFIIFHMCRNIIFGSYILTVGLIVTIVNPISRNLLKSIPDIIVFSSIASFSFILFFISFTLLALTITSMSGREQLRVEPIVLASSMFCQLIADILGKYFFGNHGGTRESLAVSFLIIFGISLAATSFYFWKVHKLVMASFVETEVPHDYLFRTHEAKKEVSQPQDSERKEFFVIGGKNYPLARLLHVRAERNYVKITWDNGTAFLRARLSDVSDQLPDDVGIQIHRSIWISRSGIEKVSISGQSIITKDNKEHTVARHRKAETEAWLRAHGFRY